MQVINNFISRFLTWAREEAGQTLVEYALIVALVSIAVVVLLGTLGGEIGDTFQAVIDELSNAVP